MATNFYVDGPNLYYAALKDRPVRWLDIAKWCEQLFEGDDVKRVRYFTAWPRPFPDRGQVRRFQVYIRALQTSPQVSLHFGRFRSEARRLPEPRPTVEHLVVTSRIKGVDVALASLLLLDAARKDCDTVVVVSNDSDLRPALRAARRLGVRVGLVNPRRRIGRDMAKLVDSYVEAPPVTSYQSALFPPEMRDARGPFTAPVTWFRKGE